LFVVRRAADDLPGISDKEKNELGAAIRRSHRRIVRALAGVPRRSSRCVE
jgi:hypothetical protein